MSSLDTFFSAITSTLTVVQEPVDEFLWLVVVGGFVCFCMAWGIGANDVANAFATSVGAKAITIKQAVIIAGIFEFLGAFALGSTVTNTIRKKITEYDLFEGEGDLLVLGMFCSLVSASLWLFLATKYQLPVSTTQSIIGAIVGFVLVSKGPAGVNWESIMYIAIFWVASPVLAAIGSVVLFLPMRQWLFRRKDSYSATLLTWPLWIFIVVFVMTLFLLLKGLKRLDLEFTIEHATWIAIVCGAGCSVLAWVVFIKTGLVDRFVTKQISGITDEQNGDYQRPQQAITMVTVDDDGQKIIKNDAQNNSDDAQNSGNEQDKDNGDNVSGGELETNNFDANRIDNVKQKDNKKSMSRMELLKNKATYGMNVDIHSDLDALESAIHRDSETFDIKTEKAFSWLQVCTATLDIFAHGSNDVANAVAPFAAMVSIYESESLISEAQVPWWILFIGASGMTIGLATYGYKIMKCLGVRMGAMSSTRGYCIELSSALVVILASYYGFPASTTHAQVGATVGVGMCEYGRKDSKMKFSTVINWKLLAQVFLGWIATLVVSGITCAVIFSFMAYSPYAGNVCRE